MSTKLEVEIGLLKCFSIKLLIVVEASASSLHSVCGHKIHCPLSDTDRVPLEVADAVKGGCGAGRCHPDEGNKTPSHACVGWIMIAMRINSETGPEHIGCFFCGCCHGTAGELPPSRALGTLRRWHWWDWETQRMAPGALLGGILLLLLK